MPTFVAAALALALIGVAYCAWPAGGAYAQGAKSQSLPACARALRPLVIQVEISDVPRRIESPFIRQKFLVEPDAYIREMSYSQACLAGELTRKWYRLPGLMQQYWIPWQNLKVDKQSLKRFVSDTFTLVERDYDLAKYDFVMIVLAATAKEWGNPGLNVYPGLLGWADDSALVTPGGRKVKGGIAIYAQSANLGKIFHNIAHIVAGVRNGRRVLPDMYDQDSASASGEAMGQVSLATLVRAQMHMGSWDPMSCNMCLRLPGVPGITSWTRQRLGWLDEGRIRTVQPGESVEVRLGPLADASTTTAAIRVPVGQSTYYLIENRQRIGHDKHLPASGVLIMYGDDNIPEPRFGRAPVRLVNADPSKPNLDGAAFDLDGNAVFSDAARGVEIRLLRKVGSSYDLSIARRP